MPSTVPPKTVEQLAAETGLYAIDAFVFVQQCLGVVSDRAHGKKAKSGNRHVTGQQLACGMRDLSIERWGLLAGVVLNRWGIYSTLDFGRIVYAMIDAGFMAKTQDDSLEDFRNVYDFRAAFEPAAYRFPKPPVKE